MLPSIGNLWVDIADAASGRSVASNIAEGRGRLTEGEFRQFLGHAQGSNYELQTQIEVARRLKFAPEEQLKKVEMLSVEVGKMLSALIATVTTRQRKQ